MQRSGTADYRIWRLRRAEVVALLVVAVILQAILVLSLIPFDGETYCWVYPSIDTRYAAGFDEGRFRRLRVGDSEESVLKRLGEPLRRFRSSNAELWYYSFDGKLTSQYGEWADYAWLLRTVEIRKGRVSEVRSGVVYN
jgi:hypothetical protein